MQRWQGRLRSHWGTVRRVRRGGDGCTLRFEVWQLRQLWVVLFLLLFLFWESGRRGATANKSASKGKGAGAPVVGVEGEVEVHDLALELHSREGVHATAVSRLPLLSSTVSPTLRISPGSHITRLGPGVAQHVTILRGGRVSLQCPSDVRPSPPPAIQCSTTQGTMCAFPFLNTPRRSPAQADRSTRIAPFQENMDTSVESALVVHTIAPLILLQVFLQAPHAVRADMRARSPRPCRHDPRRPRRGTRQTTRVRCLHPHGFFSSSPAVSMLPSLPFSCFP